MSFDMSVLQTNYGYDTKEINEIKEQLALGAGAAVGAVAGGITGAVTRQEKYMHKGTLPLLRAQLNEDMFNNSNNANDIKVNTTSGDEVVLVSQKEVSKKAEKWEKSGNNNKEFGKSKWIDKLTPNSENVYELTPEQFQAINNRLSNDQKLVAMNTELENGKWKVFNKLKVEDLDITDEAKNLFNDKNVTVDIDFIKSLTEKMGNGTTEDDAKEILKLLGADEKSLNGLTEGNYFNLNLKNSTKELLDTASKTQGKIDKMAEFLIKKSTGQKFGMGAVWGIAGAALAGITAWGVTKLVNNHNEKKAANEVVDYNV